MRSFSAHFAPLAASLLLVLLPSCSGDAPKDAPDAMLQAVKTAADDNRPDVVWDALPASYQEDVESLKTELCEQADPDVWSRGVALAGKALQVLEAKRDLLLDNPLLTELSPASTDELRQGWDGLIRAGRTLLDSDLRSVAALKGMEVKDFLEGTGRDVMEQARGLAESFGGAEAVQALADLEQTTIVVTEQDGERATVEVKSPSGSVERIPVVRVEGVWIPQDLADGWQEGVANARTAFANLRLTPAEKQEILGQLDRFDQVLDQVLAAETAEEMGGALMGALMQAGSLGR